MQPASANFHCGRSQAAPELSWIPRCGRCTLTPSTFCPVLDLHTIPLFQDVDKLVKDGFVQFDHKKASLHANTPSTNPSGSCSDPWCRMLERFWVKGILFPPALLCDCESGWVLHILLTPISSLPACTCHHWDHPVA